MAKTSTTQSLKAALTSWRLGAVSLLSLSSGMPLGLVLTGVPAWMAMAGVDIKTIGVITLAQAPYAFKFLWSPLMDRYRPPRLGRKRGWVFLCQLLLAALTFLLAAQATDPQVATVGAFTVLIAFASASQDIAIDAYTVDVLDRDEQGLAVGARVAMYRIGMWTSGVIAVSIGPVVGWGVTIAIQAVVYLALLPVSLFAPEPEVAAAPPRSMREAVWEPFVGFFQKPRALEIAAFLLLYKLADNLAVSLVRPFFVQKGYHAFDIGIASGTVGLVFTMLGTFVGGVLTTSIGVGRALWLFGLLQTISNLGYAIVAEADVSRPLMYASMALDSGASGMGTGAFSVLLIRLTQKRFSATQYALFSSIFGLGRTIAGPIAGALVDALGWTSFFVLTLPCGLPGLAMLQRFVPITAREVPPELESEEGRAWVGRPLSRGGLAWRGGVGLAAGAALGLASSAALAALKAARGGNPFDFVAQLSRIVSPATPGDWIDLAASLVFGVLTGFAVATYLAARRGVAPRPTGTGG